MSKYKSQPTEYMGQRYDSKKEAQYAAILEMSKRALHPSDKVVSVERQPVFELAGGIKYKADFRVTYADGRVDVIDVKGFETPIFKLKKKLMQDKYPNIKLKII